MSIELGIGFQHYCQEAEDLVRRPKCEHGSAAWNTSDGSHLYLYPRLYHWFTTHPFSQLFGDKTKFSTLHRSTPCKLRHKNVVVCIMANATRYSLPPRSALISTKIVLIRGNSELSRQEQEVGCLCSCAARYHPKDYNYRMKRHVIRGTRIVRLLTNSSVTTQQYAVIYHTRQVDTSISHRTNSTSE